MTLPTALRRILSVSRSASSLHRFKMMLPLSVLALAVVACESAEDISGSSTPTLVDASVQPAAVSLAPGASRQFNALGMMSDGSTVSIPVTWSATGGTIDANGLYTAGHADGIYEVVATETSADIADTAQVTISQSGPSLASITVSPSSASLNAGDTRQFSATGTMSDGSSTSVSVSWSATGGSIDAGGLYTAGQTDGSYEVVATEPGAGLTDTAEVTIGQAAPTLASIAVSPGSATLNPGGTQQFSATGIMTDGSTTTISVSWSATGGTIDQAGLYTAGQTEGSFQVVATETGAGLSETAQVFIVAPGSFPVEYSLSRPLLQNNPGALLAGEDWQDKSQTSDLNGEGFYINKWAANRSGQYADASTVTVPYTAGARRAELVSDPTFGKAVRNWQTDGSDGDEHVVYYGGSWGAVSKCWTRILIKYQSGFTTDGPGGGAAAWKLIFGPGPGRTWTWTNTTQLLYQNQDGWFGGSISQLPGSDGFAHQESTEWSDEEWWEMIVYVERLSSTSQRKRFWYRELTQNGTIKSSTANATWWHRHGSQETGASSVPTNLCGALEMGINRNKLMFSGDVQWYQWGPWEVIDGNVIPDPYGIADQIIN